MDNLVTLYLSGLSIPDVARETGVEKTKVFRVLRDRGVLRSKKEALAIASSQGKLGSGFRGKNRVFTQEHKDAIRAGRREWASKNRRGWRINSCGYVEYTWGPHKNRLQHTVVMESIIGRRISENECVHHIDGVKTNNDPSNLRLMTKQEHSRLHRLMDIENGKVRERDKNGRFC